MSNSSSQTKVLIVGGSGFLSGTLATSAISRGCQVWTVTRGLRPLPEKSINLIADRQDREAFKRVIEAAQMHWDMVIDCIAFTPQDIQQDLNVFERLARHLVFVSTDFVYDPPHRQFPQVEATDHYVSDGYGYQKRLAELALIQYPGDLPWTIVRPCHIYGPGSQLGCLPTHSRDPELIDRMQAGEPLKLVGGGHFLQQPVLAKDLADFLLDLHDNKNTYSQVMNIAGPDVIESRTYYAIVADILGVDLDIEEISIKTFLAENPLASSFICHRFYDLSKAQAIDIPLPSTPIIQGLREHVESLLHGTQAGLIAGK